VVTTGDILNTRPKTLSPSTSITSQILYTESLCPMRNQAIKDEIISRRANPIAVPNIAKKGRKLRSSEKKNTATTPRIIVFAIHFTKFVRTLF